MNVDVLDGDALLALPAVSLQRFDLRRRGSCQLVEGALCAVLLRDVFDMGEPARKGHDGVMNRSHLSGEHGLDLVARLDPFDDCEREVDAALVRLSALRRGIAELR